MESYRITVEAVTYSGCEHTSALSRLEEGLDVIDGEVERLSDKRERHERFKIIVPKNISETKAEDVITNIVLKEGSSHQSVKTDVIGNYT